MIVRTASSVALEFGSHSFVVVMGFALSAFAWRMRGCRYPPLRSTIELQSTYYCKSVWTTAVNEPVVSKADAFVVFQKQGITSDRSSFYQK